MKKLIGLAIGTALLLTAGNMAMDSAKSVFSNYKHNVSVAVATAR